MKILYFDCFAGASGNMILAALVALGVDKNKLKEQLETLQLPKFEIKYRAHDKSGIAALHAEVVVKDEKKHRHLPEIAAIINNSPLDAKIKNRAMGIFENLAAAEAMVHGIDIEKVHFHEVGALDAIIDVIGVCVGFEMLKIEKFVCSKIHVGSGFVQMAHGKYPIPPPAVAELLKNIPIYSTEIEGELITPTGAAIISAVCGEFGAIPEMSVEKTAYGAGSREYAGFPNVLRLLLGTSDERRTTETENVKIKNKKQKTKNATLVLIETNIDDLSPQILGFVMERAFELGALDCWFTPIQMKKNRPATMISILCDESEKDVFTELLYAETSTLGARVSKIERNCLPREIIKVETEFGAVDVKIATNEEKIVNAKPEYDQIREIAVRLNKPLKEIERKVIEKLDL